MTAIADVLALSPLQEGLFAIAGTGDGAIYTMQFVADITGPLDARILRRSLDTMLRRHPNLGVSFWAEGLPKPVQIVPVDAAIPWRQVYGRLGNASEIARRERETPFDISRGPLLRAVLAGFADQADRRRLILTAHHIVLDGWSMAVFARELFAIYSAGGQDHSLPAPPRYRDYIAWLAGRDDRATGRAWAGYLSALSGPLLLAETGPAAIPGRPTRFRHSLGKAATENLRAWAKAQGLTLNTVTAFAWSVVLSRLTGRTDVVFGTTVSGRPPGLAGVESMTGLFINTVPVATEAGLTGTAAGQCHRLQRDCAAMRAHEHYSLSAIQRAAGSGTLFDTLFVFENAPIGSATEVVTTADGVSFTPLTMESLAHYPLTVVAYLADGRLVILLEATPAAFPDIRIDDIGARLTMLLDCLPAHADTAPGWLPVVLPGDAAVVSPPAGALAEGGVGARFLSQAARTPSALALWADGVNYTYRELAELVSGAAAGLRHYGIGPERPVVLAMERSADTVVAILAVLVAGGCYVPLDLTLPRPRIRSMLRQSRASLVVASGTDQPDLGVRSVTMGQLQSHGQFPASSAGPAGRAAYVIFTSGSTGEPKGVTGTHDALLSYFADHRRRVYEPAVSRLGRTLRIAHAWTFSFDASWQPLAGLLDGHSVHLVNDDDMRDAGQIVKTIAGQRIDMIDTTPSMYAQLEAAGLRPGALAVLALGGEPIPVSRWDELRALPATAVYNCYGPTETTVEAMIATVNPGTGQDETGPGQVTIGEPAAGMSATLLDAALRPVPQGVAGELYLAGPQLTRGYAGQPGLTATAFIADPGGRGQRMYRTGDMARRLINGRISFLGRADSQVKIRGYRIEISEIETALAAQDGVAAAAVIARPGPTGKVLIAFAAGSCIDTRAVRAGLLRRIPGYMLPSRLHTIAALPLTSNGKIDVTQLHQLDDSLPPSGNPVGQAPTSTERILCAALTSLGAVAAGPETELDSLGLDSIAAIALVNQLRQQGLTVTPHMVLTYPAVSDLAAAIDTQPDRRLAAEPASGPVPPLPIVQWLQEYGNYRRFTQTVLIALPPDIALEGLRSVLQDVLDTHAMLRARLGPDGQIFAQPAGTVSARRCLTESIVQGDLAGELSAHARAAVEQIDPAAGELLRAVWLRRAGEPDVLLMAVHHLATDVVSWHIIFAALAAAWDRLAVDGGAPNPEVTGYREWCQRLTARASAPEVGAQQQYWEAQLAGADPPLGWRYPDPDTDTWASLRETVIATPAGLTRAIIGALTPARGSGAPSVREFLLAALVLTLRTWRARKGESAPEVLIALEGHGREDDVLGTDTSATVGWFTTVYPQRFTAGAGSLDAVMQESGLAWELVNAVTAQLNTLPNRGLDFGVLKYLRGGPALRTREPQVEFNYVGRFDLSTAGRAAVPGPWAPLVDQRLHSQLPVAPEPQLPLRYALDVSAAIGAGDSGPVLSTGWRWSTALFAESDIAALTEIWSAAVEVLAQGLRLSRGSDDNTAHRALS